MSVERAEQLEIPALRCKQDEVICPMSGDGRLCQVAARAIVSAAVEADPTYEPNTRLALHVEAAILMDSMVVGQAVQRAGRTACLGHQAFHNLKAAESPMSSIYS